MGARKGTGNQASQQMHRRSRKPKFELGKPRKVNDKKKKDKKTKQRSVANQMITRLGLEQFPLMFDEIRASNRRLKELISEINADILHKLATWEAQDK